MRLGAGGEASTVIGDLGEEHAEGVTVYNLEVEDVHSYFVRGEAAAVGASCRRRESRG